MNSPTSALGMSALAAPDAAIRARRREWDELLRRPDATPLSAEPERSIIRRSGLERVARFLRSLSRAGQASGSIG